MYKIAQIGVFDYENYGDVLFPEILYNELGGRLGEICVELFSPKGGIKAFSDVHVFSIDELETKCKQEKYDAIVVGGGDLIRFDKSVAYNDSGCTSFI